MIISSPPASNILPHSIAPLLMAQMQAKWKGKFWGTEAGKMTTPTGMINKACRKAVLKIVPCHPNWSYGVTTNHDLA